MPLDWLNFTDPTKTHHPEEHGKNDARHGEDACPPKVDIMDRIFGDTERVQDAADKYATSYNAEKETIRSEQNNDYLRQIAESLKDR